MKKLLFIISLLSCNINIHAQKLAAYFSYCSFDVPGQTPYLETYLNVVGTSVNLISGGNNTRKGTIEVKWVIRSGDKIVHFDKYNLISPEISAADLAIPDFIDQQRTALDKGNYNIELSIRDKNSTSIETVIKQDITIGFPTDTISISDIEQISNYSQTTNAGKFTKSGYDMIPFVQNFYPKEINSLKFYAEIYRADISPADDYLVRYYISSSEKREILENYLATLKQSPKSTNVVMGDFNISKLLSGNYNLNIEIRNKKNQLIAFKQLFFQRSNVFAKPYISDDVSKIDVTNTFISSVTERDTLIEYIACLYPISSGVEADMGENQIKYPEIRSMQQYIYYFWAQRNPADPQKAWVEYKQEVNKVNYSYSTLNKKGYDTDRGRVYLQYGPPNVISNGNDDVEAYPYEVWQYYKLEKQSNRKFIFYALERTTNDYRLLHSDAIGEIYSPNWDAILHKRTQEFGNDLDQEKSIPVYGSHTDDNFSNPH